jgi:hypothetical protein
MMWYNQLTRHCLLRNTGTDADTVQMLSMRLAWLWHPISWSNINIKARVDYLSKYCIEQPTCRSFAQMTRSGKCPFPITSCNTSYWECSLNDNQHHCTQMTPLRHLMETFSAANVWQTLDNHVSIVTSVWYVGLVMSNINSKRVHYAGLVLSPASYKTHYNEQEWCLHWFILFCVINGLYNIFIVQ